MTGLQIIVRENEADRLNELAAQRQLYSWAKLMMTIQMVLAIVIAIAGSFLQSKVTGAEPYVVIAGAVVAMLDVLLLDPLKVHFQKLAARIQESFDCAVLDLPWREVKASKPEASDIKEYSRHIAGNSAAMATLNDWYPPEGVKDLPLRPARILCQRENCLYDSRLRQRYILGVTIVLILLSAVTFLIALIENRSVVETLAAIVAPLIPAYVIGFREISANRESQDRLERLKQNGDDVWQRALANSATDEELDALSRLLQDEIFEHRMKSPVVFDWVYNTLRSANETLMSQSTKDLAEEYKKQNA